MAYKKTTIAQAQRFYVLEGKTLEEIADLLKISKVTLARWRKAYAWDEQITDASTINIANKMQVELLSKISAAIEAGKLTDPAFADAAHKLIKILEKMRPKGMMLANIFILLKEVSDYLNAYCTDDGVKEAFATLLPGLSDHLRRKYTDD